MIGTSWEAVLDLAKARALKFLDSLPTRSVSGKVEAFEPRELSEKGLGVEGALNDFDTRYEAGLSASAGPRYWGFVTGGTTPAGLVGDWLTTAFDQNAQLSGDNGSAEVEREAISWLRELLGLPASFYGGFVSGATMSNFVGLAIGRQAQYAAHGVNAAKHGLIGAPRLACFGGAVHSSSLKALAMLGLGRDCLETIPLVLSRECIEIAQLEKALAQSTAPAAIVIASAGTVNTVDFDDFEALAALKKKFGFYLHIDAAFGAFAACSPSHQAKLNGWEHADSITVDCHKWLNTPYDSGVYLVADRHLESQVEVFKNLSPYLGDPVTDPRNVLHLTPENSRRFRALATWMPLQAYGRAGHRELVERSIRLAQSLGEKIARLKDYELASPVRLNVACFRHKKLTVAQLQAAIRQENTFLVSPSVLDGQPVLRAALTNWSTEDADIERAVATFEKIAEASG